MIIKCPECGHQVSDHAKTCPSCGIEIAGKITRCPDCGEVIFKEQAMCPNCHCTINGASQNPEEFPAQKTVGLSPRIQVSETKKSQNDVPQAPKSGQGENEQNVSPRKHKAGITALIVAFVIALIVVFLAVYFMKNQERQNEMRAYENALISTEPLVLQNFLDMYADAPQAHRDTINAHLGALKKIDSDWADALVNNSKFGFERFLKQHPQSVYCKEAEIKIDSLDWVTANSENTPQAFQQYMTNHQDGAYYDEANLKFQHLEAQKVTPEEKQMVSHLFVTYFNALAQKDESALISTLAPVLTSFLHRQNATKADVISYMHKLHEADIMSMEFTPNNDWEIEKEEVSEGLYKYKVNFSVAQTMERIDSDREKSAAFKVTAEVSPEGRISELTMRRSVQ